LIIPLLWVPVAAVPHDMRPQVPQLERDHTVVGGGMDARTAYEHVFSTSSRHFDDGLSLYFSRPFLIGRYVVYAIGFFLFALGANRATRITAPGQMRWFGPVGLIVLVFMLHLLSTDWFILLDPGWYSTDFPLVWISGQAIAGIAVAIAAAAWFGDKDPRERGSSGHVRGLDWGNLLLASVMVWAYVAFVQLLIIWSGNLPAEIAWYRHRSNGDWRWVAVALAVIAFAIPFFLLLSRRTKKHRRGLLAVALFLFGGQLLYTIWMIVPAFPITGAADVGLRIALVATTLALFLNRYLALARSASVALAP
ncbi:MAG TPA: hypothetical protein VHE61_07430, partial [Opitutaceae bacterium]|nr:hypothetical protein [Opitutaceae bacterium]